MTNERPRRRGPPKGWRRNMVTAALFLAILDVFIISGGQDEFRIIIATGITIVVLFLITGILRRNARREREEAASSKT